MKKLTLITGSTLLLGAGGALAAINCTPTPDCYDLGYTSSDGDCSGDYVRCPFDSNSVFCIEVPDQCTELGYTKVATNGNYSCSEGQTISKCAKNTDKYKCDGTACNYGYYLYYNLAECGTEFCCDMRATTGNTNCYKRVDNTSYKQYSYDYVRCLAASYSGSGYGDLPYVATRTYNGGTYKDACGNPQYTVAYFCMKQDCIGYNCDTSNCGYSTPSCTYKSWYSGYDDSGYQSDCTNNPCYEEWMNESYMSDDEEGYYEYDGESMRFSEYCYKKYNLRTSCGGMKFMGEEIPYSFDYY